MSTLRVLKTLKNKMAKSVCIIGAGPAGLITAKTLLDVRSRSQTQHQHQNHQPASSSTSPAFTITIFEKSSRIGGLWPLPSQTPRPSPEASSVQDDTARTAGMVNPLMHTNISRWNMSFSSFPWSSAARKLGKSEDEIAQFPLATEVGGYLEGFVEEFGLGEWIRTGCEVVSAEKGADGGWSVVVESDLDVGGEGARNGDGRGFENEKRRNTHYFDFLIVASGFFAEPKIPASFELRDGVSEKNVPVIHSTQFRSVEELLRDRRGEGGDRIVVVGGSMSGTEVAAAVAMELSSVVNSPGATKIKDAKILTVHHIFKRPFWVLPSLLPTKAMLGDGDIKKPNPSSPFLPLDVTMYDFSRRPPGPLQNYSGHITPETALQANNRFETLLGTDQSDLHPLHSNEPDTSSPLTLQGSVRTEAPWIGISDHYSEFARSGLIVPSLGHVDSFNPSISALQISTNKGPATLANIAAIILATGFEATSSLSFLDPQILEDISYDPLCSPFPILLDLHGTSSPKYPHLGFVGMYRGPYWGVMELQARLLASIFLDATESSTSKVVAYDNGAEEIRKLRVTYRENPTQLAQYPMGDFVYLMESMRGILGGDLKAIPSIGDGDEAATKISSTSMNLGNPVIPARYPSSYLGPNTGHSSDNSALVSFSTTLQASQRRGKFIAAAIFRALHGRWSLHRKLTSKIATYPSGVFTGTATFNPRVPSAEGYTGEYLYEEMGELVTVTGMKFQAKRGYVYRYATTTDTLSAWFVKPTEPLVVDYLFHDVEIIPPLLPSSDTSHGSEGRGWKARSTHLCIADTYDVEYEFWFHGVAIKEWRMEYQVRGPNKDYKIENLFTRL